MQYLRKALFPVHEDLRYAGLLNPVDAPHHMRMDDRSKYREGVVLRPKKKQGDVDIDTNRGSLVDVGLRNPIRVDRKLQPNIRVTVEIDAKKSRKSKLIGKIVRPATPRTKMGIYWGYDVRLATSLSEVWTGCPYGKSSVSAGSSSSSSSSSSNGYDFVIGTSENGEMASGPQKDTNGNDGDDNKINLLGVKPFQHLLVVFGGLSGLESVVDSDEQLHVTKEDTSTLFDMYLNTCPAQGSRTIRTEEALLITMSLLRPYIQNNKTPTTNT
jgi:predicted SPOUT superfamily RNA methylase MTH1